VEIGTQHTRVLGNANLATRTINSGNPIMVCGLLVTNSNPQADDVINFTDADGTTILTIACPMADTVKVGVAWLADNGFIVGTAATVGSSAVITVLWRPDI